MRHEAKIGQTPRSDRRYDGQRPGGWPLHRASALRKSDPV